MLLELNTHSWGPKYDGGAGMDFSANLALDDIDFGTFHLYPIGN